MASAGSCWRSIYNFRPETELSDEASESANQSSGKEVEELMKHGYVVGRIGEDGTRKELIKLSKVVFHTFVNFRSKIGRYPSTADCVLVACSYVIY